MTQTPDTPLDRLPLPYAFAWRLRAAGVNVETIASGLGVPTEAVETLLALADAKLEREQLRARQEGT